MSLLMQALKKAEHAKQKQGGSGAEQPPPPEPGAAKAPDEALSLSPRELAPENAPSTPAVDDMQGLTGAFGGEQPTSGLSTEHANNPALRSADPLPFEPAPLEPSPPAFIANHQAVPDAQSPQAVQAQPPAQTVAETPVASVERANPADRIPVRAPLPKIDPEQRQAALELGKNITAEKQKKAQSVFGAKQSPGRRPTFLVSVVGITALIVLAGLGYIYWQVTGPATNTFVPVVATMPAQPLPLAVEPAVPVQAAAGEIVAASPVQAGPEVATNTRTTTVPATAIPPSVAAPRPDSAKATAPNSPAATAVTAAVNPQAGNVPATSTAPTPAPATIAATSKPRSDPAVQPADSSAIKIRQTTIGNEINPGLTSAYQLFMAGDATAAGVQYRKVLQQEPNNRDALLGLAAIALNQRKPEQAGTLYSRLLELDPADPDAIAGLTSLQQGDPAQSESRLKKILAQDQQSGAVLFALANLYAQQSRWTEAQQTYFRAYTTAPDNPDYAFNLAVSLDRLNQSRLAEEYYQRALTLGQKSAGNFSRKSVLNRIRELQTPVEN